MVQSREIPAPVFLDGLVWTMVECDSWLLGPQPTAGFWHRMACSSVLSCAGVLPGKVQMWLLDFKEARGCVKLQGTTGFTEDAKTLGTTWLPISCCAVCVPGRA